MHSPGPGQFRETGVYAWSWNGQSKLGESKGQIERWRQLVGDETLLQRLNCPHATHPHDASLS
ncbi:MAG TPA: hypothetical protein PLV85_26390, partial [Polyangiaceae bacterium]|nr:hypothetical protein [Polyangiaceae bacterium]